MKKRYGIATIKILYILTFMLIFTSLFISKKVSAFDSMPEMFKNADLVGDSFVLDLNEISDFLGSEQLKSFDVNKYVKYIKDVDGNPIQPNGQLKAVMLCGYDEYGEDYEWAENIVWDSTPAINILEYGESRLYSSGGNYFTFAYRTWPKLAMLYGEDTDEIVSDKDEVYVIDIRDRIAFTIFTKIVDVKDETVINCTEVSSYPYEDTLTFYVDDSWTEDKIASVIFMKNDDIDISIYDGFYQTLEEISTEPEKEITDRVLYRVLDLPLTDSSEGIKISGTARDTGFGTAITIVIKHNGKAIEVMPIYLRVETLLSAHYQPNPMLYDEYGNSVRGIQCEYSGSGITNSRNMVYIYSWIFNLEELQNYDISDQYYLWAPGIHTSSSRDLDIIEKAVEGFYPTLESASNQQDVKNKIFSYETYANPVTIDNNYSLQYTVFFKGGSVYYLNFAFKKKPEVSGILGDIISIDEHNFPDDIFRKLVTDKIDYDHNGLLDKAEAESVVRIGFVSGIRSLKGIEYFTNLIELRLNVGDDLQEIDISNNSNLVKLYLSGGKTVIEEIDLTNNEYLRELSLDGLGLSSIDVNNCPHLEFLSCRNNNLTSIDLSNNKLLQSLYCENNKLKDLGIGENKILKKLICYNNNIKDINISECEHLCNAFNEGRITKDIREGVGITGYYASNPKVRSSANDYILQVDTSCQVYTDSSIEQRHSYRGDIDGDGDINAKDVTMLRRYLAGGWNVTIHSENSDIDGDGNINAKDVTMLRRYLTGGWGVILSSKTF